MQKRPICIDIDNVIAQTDTVIREIIREYTGGRVDLNYQDIVEFDYWKCKDAGGNTISRQEWNDVHDLFSEPSNLLRVAPYPDIKEWLQSLAEGYDIHLATSRLPRARKGTVAWLEEHSLQSHSLHFLPHRQKHLIFRNMEMAVEDDYDQALCFAHEGIKCFLISHPWNMARTTADKLSWVEDWHQILSLSALSTA